MLFTFTESVIHVGDILQDSISLKTDTYCDGSFNMLKVNGPAYMSVAYV